MGRTACDMDGPLVNLDTLDAWVQALVDVHPRAILASIRLSGVAQDRVTAVGVLMAGPSRRGLLGSDT